VIPPNRLEAPRFVAMMRAFALSLLLASACQSTPEQPPLSDDLPEPAVFHPDEDLLRGFDEAFEPAIRVGDRMLFGVRLTDDAFERTWYLALRVLADVAVQGGRPMIYTSTAALGGGTEIVTESWVVPVQVDLLDADGATSGSSRILLPGRLLETGLAHACRANRAVAAGTASVEEMRHTNAQGLGALLAVMQAVQEEKLLADLLWEVVEPPSVLGVLLNAGVAAVVRADLASSKAGQLVLDGRTHEGERAPIAILVNGEPAMFAELVAVAPSSPFTMSGGILRISGQHPSRPSRRLEIQLVAARRGNHRGKVVTVTGAGGFRLEREATTLEIER